ncbi:hypothetical protein GCM10025777_31510 [Membranihabitans marinus]|uniref:Uncharacterized protein n=1 Tax=Nesterenkonia rhizosphaerae TaxID=1348272 RepID=A0ABP9FTM2_9MICC
MENEPGLACQEWVNGAGAVLAEVGFGGHGGIVLELASAQGDGRVATRSTGAELYPRKP